MKKAFWVGMLAGVLAAGTALAAEKPAIDIHFDDDASSLLVSVQWKEKDGSPRRESYSFGKDMHVLFDRDAEGWRKLDQEFQSRNWEAFLLPGADGFLLMQREYDGKHFHNVSLALYKYVPARTVVTLGPAEGSPYWSPDGQRLALVNEVDGRATVTVYKVADGGLEGVKTDLDEAALKAAVGEYRRARVCDDNEPCESGPEIGGEAAPPDQPTDKQP